MERERDRLLLKRLRAGEQAAFEELARAHAPRLLAVARRFVGEEDAQDAVQDTFLQAFRALASFQGNALLSTWLHRIVVNACLMRLRTRRRRPEVPMHDLLPRFLEDGHQADPAVPWRDSPERALERRDVRQLVRAGIDQLPDDYRSVLLLRDVEDLDTAETAELLGISVAAVKTRLHRARQALRGLLDPDLRGEAT